jgi:inhibitor of cysteine peptidase
MLRRLDSRTWSLLVVGVLPLALAGCPWSDTPTDDSGEAKLVAFESSNELLDYFKGQVTARHRNRGGNWPFGFGGFGAMGAEDAATDGEAGSATPQDQSYSTTNIQETGVDESDVVKSDGTYFYIARENTLRIVGATPADAMTEVGRLELDVHVTEMYLRGSRLILLAQGYEGYANGNGAPEPAAEIMIWPPYYRASELTVIEVDISDPSAPAATREAELEGALASSRLVNDRLILVLTIVPDVPEDPSVLDISLLTLDDVMPQVRTQARESHMVQWQQCLHPESPDGYFMTAVITLDADDVETIVHSVAVLADAGTIYASPQALYVTDADYDADDEYREITAVHKFAFDDDGAAQYVASGSVPGRLLNQFSLSEHEGYLRLATHVQDARFFGWGGGPLVGVAVADAGDDVAVGNAQRSDPPQDYSAVYVLEQDGAALGLVGSVEDVAPNEQLHSARFVGTHGFLVTFRRIDPLFAIDLSDPANPEIKGELKIPGYSDYLHPLGENHLIGVGRTVITLPSWGAEEPGAAQLSLFDVSDLENPTVVQQLSLGGMHSWSYVTQTHKAFTLLSEEGLLAIPMRLTDDGTSYVEYDPDAFYGVVCLEVDPESGFTELGRLAAVGTPAYDYESWYPSGGFWMRAAFIGDTVYAISADGVAAAPVDDMADVSTVELED